MNRLTFTATLSLAFAASPAIAAQDRIHGGDPRAMDIAKTPVTDLNIDKREIPELLQEAERQPYATTDAVSCNQLVGEIQQLDEMLGPDLDLPEEERSRISAGRVAKTVVSSFIPFRGLIREISGANDHERKVQVAVQAGLARRGFLKGVGMAKGCAYPARPASTEMVLAEVARRRAEKEKDEND